MSTEYKYLEIREGNTGEVVHNLDVTEKSELEIMDIRRAWSSVLDHKQYYLEVSTYDQMQ